MARKFYSMARERGNQSFDASAPEDDRAKREESESGARFTAIPELMRRALTLGFSGFFLTEEAIRRALGDTLPKDWIDFAVEQSARTRSEFVERLSYEIGRTFDNVDLAAVLRDLLEGRTLEVKAEIRLGPKEEGADAARIEVGFAHRKREE